MCTSEYHIMTGVQSSEPENLPGSGVTFQKHSCGEEDEPTESTFSQQHDTKED